MTSGIKKFTRSSISNCIVRFASVSRCTNVYMLTYLVLTSSKDPMGDRVRQVWAKVNSSKLNRPGCTVKADDLLDIFLNHSKIKKLKNLTKCFCKIYLSHQQKALFNYQQLFTIKLSCGFAFVQCEPTLLSTDIK